VRALAPISVIAIVAAGAAIAPTIASATPALPQITAQNLLVKAMTSKADAFSGTVSLTTNLGLPALPDISGRANPLSLLSGTHTLQVAADGPQKQRIALLDTMSEYDVIHNGNQVWLYDSQQNAVSYGTDSGGDGATHQRSGTAPDRTEVPMTPQQAAQQILSEVSPSTNISVDQTLSVAGRAAYILVVSPKEKGSLIGRVEIAIDAQNGAALQVSVYPTGSNTAAIKIGFTSVSFAAPPASRFDFTAPKGATVSPMNGNGGAAQKAGPMGSSNLGPQVLGQDWLSVLELHGVDLNQLRNQAAQSSDGRSGGDGANATGLFNGDLSSYLDALLGAGTNVSGAFGSGKLYTTNFLTFLLTNDGRVFVGPVTSSVLESEASAQGMK
jgi:outer membrane lipoprotein-sorting protein